MGTKSKLEVINKFDKFQLSELDKFLAWGAKFNDL